MSKLNLEEICKQLAEENRIKQNSALKELSTICEDSTLSSTRLLTIFDECYLHLLKCYSAKFESVRDSAVQTVMQYLNRLPPNDFHLLNVVATLKERMGQPETIEDCETIRYLYVAQLYLLICAYKDTRRGNVLHQCYADIVQILSKALTDPYPVVQREACKCVTALAQSAEAYTFSESAGQLAKSVYGVLNHKHSQSRIAAVSALGPLALHINASGEDLSRLLMEVSPLLMDSMPLVRRECGELGTLLLLQLRDRYSYFDRIIPLVLCCLKDDAPDVVDYIRPLWVKCGKQYYEENEAELSKQELVDKKPPNYPLGVERPTIGCRGLVQRSLRLLKLIVREAGDWKENVRIHSLRLLYQFVLHAEAAMTAKFFEIYPDVARACRDSETSVVNTAVKVADLMGRLLSYPDWCEHGFEGLEKNAKEGYLKCFYYMFAPAIGPGYKDILRVTKLLVTKDFSHSLKLQIQIYVMKMMENLLEKMEALNDDLNAVDGDEPDWEEVERNIYIITIKVMALASDGENANNEQLQDRGIKIMEKIVKRQGISLDDLHEHYFGYALDQVDTLDAPLDALTEPILMLYGLLSIAKFRAPYLDKIEIKLNEVWNNCADDAKVKIFSVVSVIMLNWTETLRKPIDESVKLLKNFLMNVVEQHLVWRAGASAEALRSIATATLCSMSQGAKEEAKLVFPHFAKYFSNLLEDRAVSTRHYAVRCLLNFTELSVEEMKPIAYMTLSRLDDPSSEIRNLAVMALSHLTPKYDNASDDKESENFDKDVWLNFIKQAFDILFLHYEGPEERLKTSIKDTLKQLCITYPEICKESYERALAMCSSSSCLHDLKSQLPSQ